MFASLPFILLLILQGFARQDCVELLLGSPELANIPIQAKSLKAFDELFVHLTLVRKVQKNNGIVQAKRTVEISEEITRISFKDRGLLESGFFSIQRSRDGPVA